MPRVYATRVELVEYAPPGVTVPDDPEATRQLTRASERVDVAIRAAVYDVDASGLPTDPDVTAALRDAVCALVVHWIDHGDEDGQADNYSTVSIGGVTLTRKPATTDGSRTGRADDLPDAARTHLALAGLLDGVIFYR